MTELERLRALLEDELADEAETAAGDGSTTTFFVRNPPAADDPTTTVTIDGVAQTRGVDFFVTDGGRSITISPAPFSGASIVIRYQRQTFTDDALSDYLALAALDWDAGSVGLVYRAALLALDTLLIGTATAVDFGEGAESFQLSSVYERLAGLRALYAQALAAEAARPHTFAPIEPPVVP